MAIATGHVWMTAWSRVSAAPRRGCVHDEAAEMYRVTIHLDLTFRQVSLKMMNMDEPLPPASAKKLILAIMARGTLSFSSHAYEEMEKDDLDEADVRNTLRGGRPQPAELEKGSWRYRFATSRMVAVVAFRSETSARVVTAWRLSKK